MKSLYKGFIPLFTRQTVAWVTFLAADAQMKEFLRSHLNLKTNERIPSKYLAGGSFCVAILNTLVIMPFDAIKTHMQKQSNTCTTQHQAFRLIVDEAGYKGLMVGWRIRFAMYQLHALMTMDLLDRLEVKFRNHRK